MSYHIVTKPEGEGPSWFFKHSTFNSQLSTSSIHPLYALHLTHSFPQRAFLNSFGINSLRTLSIATGAYLPLALFPPLSAPYPSARLTPLKCAVPRIYLHGSR